MSSRRGSPRRTRSWLRIVVATFLVLAAAGVAVGCVVGVLLYREIRRELPPLEQILDYEPPAATQVYASDGKLIGEFFFEKRYPVALAEIPKHVRDAFLAAEDADFYEHPGIDVRGITRAFLANVLRGEVVQGGSTITQQVVKALLLTPKKSYERKVKEILLALRLEEHLSKDEILYLYLNQIYLGSGAYGVAAAAQEYFGKTPNELTVAEGSLLAGLPQAPSRYSPVRHPERARKRQIYVLRQMEKEGFLSEETRAAAEAEPVEIASERGRSYRHAPFYVEHVRRHLQERYGSEAANRLGLQVYTALDLDMQKAAEASVRSGLETLDKRQGFRGPIRRLEPEEVAGVLDAQERSVGELEAGGLHEAVIVSVAAERVELRIGHSPAIFAAEGTKWAGDRALEKLQAGDVIRVRVESVPETGPLAVSLDQYPQVQGALVAMEPDTGFVRAMVGGYAFGRTYFNRAVQARRQPGSSFKPFIYAAAFDREFTPASVLLDAPVVYDTADFVWRPENYSTRFYGPTRLREAITHSRNVVTVRLAEKLGIGYLTKYLPRFGFTEPFPRNLSISLGSAEVTPLELVRAYGAFASLGKLADPIFVTRIIDREGNVLDERTPELVDVISPETAYLITSLLQDVVRRGTGRGALSIGRPVAGKTGTTNDQMDAWFLGYTPDLVAGAWVGFDEKKTLGRRETGGRAALPIWTDFMKTALERTRGRSFEVPDGVVFVNVDRESGLRAGPDDSDPLLECFRRGTEPQRMAPREVGVAPRDFFRGDF